MLCDEEKDAAENAADWRKISERLFSTTIKDDCYR